VTPRGLREGFTDLDLAALRDVGWEVVPEPESEPESEPEPEVVSGLLRQGDAHDRSGRSDCSRISGL
jgi:hypothetical protein